jgi:hypothetical protein
MPVGLPEVLSKPDLRPPILALPTPIAPAPIIMGFLCLLANAIAPLDLAEDGIDLTREAIVSGFKLALIKPLSLFDYDNSNVKLLLIDLFF